MTLLARNQGWRRSSAKQWGIADSEWGSKVPHPGNSGDQRCPLWAPATTVSPIVARRLCRSLHSQQFAAFFTSMQRTNVHYSQKLELLVTQIHDFIPVLVDSTHDLMALWECEVPVLCITDVAKLVWTELFSGCPQRQTTHHGQFCVRNNCETNNCTSHCRSKKNLLTWVVCALGFFWAQQTSSRSFLNITTTRAIHFALFYSFLCRHLWTSASARDLMDISSLFYLG